MKLRLEHPTLGTLYLDEAHGYTPASLDLGSPVVREVVEDVANSNGTDDSTVLYGSRPITITVAVVEDARTGTYLDELITRLGAYTAPGRRPYLYMTPGHNLPERRVLLRGSMLGAPRELPGYSAVQASWVAPTGVIEAATPLQLVADAAPQGQPGVSFPITLPFSFPAGSLQGAAEVSNPGSEPTTHVTQLWGPAADPTLTDVETGAVLALTGLALTAGQYAEVDVANLTVTMNGRASEPLDDYLSEDATWFWLRPGVSHLRYAPATYSDGARAVVTWRPASLH